MHQNAHQHAARDFGRAFGIGVALNLIYVVVELAWGLAVGSLSLIADAGHNFSDILGLLIAWLAYRLAKVKPTRRYTYGLRSATIWASLTNAMLLLIAVGAISWEAVRRLSQPVETAGMTIVWVAAIGVLINTLTAMLFYQGRAHDLNIKGAYLHMAADAAVSLGVVVAGFGILATGWLWIDPAVSLLIAVVIFVGTWGLLRDSVRLAVHGVPKDIAMSEIERELLELPGVTAIHDLHVWALSTTETAITVHLVKPQSGDDDALLSRAATMLRRQFGIAHSTIQIERDPGIADCRQVSETDV